ncbi:MAG TPA: LytTR family DNA-binding domain-containing protein [Burkholderiaceae bacterium]|nr:LytTR family DNA-binding domain-containing protein [Burkholderiaceae bacterium]
MTTAVIADDEPHLAAYLRTELAKLWPDLQVLRIARNGVEAAAAIAELQPDLAFLDIKMPGLSGLEVAQGIEGTTGVVFVTAYDEFAVQAFDHEAIDYVLKPVKAERLARTMARVQRALVHAAAPAAADDADARLARVLRTLLPSSAAPGLERLRYVRASHGELTQQIAVDDVLFFRADDKYTCVQTVAGEHLIRTTIAELNAQLDLAQFWQIHRSTIVNLRHVAGTRRDDLSRLYVRVRGYDGELPVSRAYVHLFKAM